MIYDKEAYLRGLKDVYAQEIREGLGFWAEHGMDWEQGGIVTYLDRDGNWYCDEKQGWFTGRAMYAFARAYSDVYPDPRFLAAAENLYDFMVRRQFDPATGKLYHNMTRGGRPIDSDLIPDVTYPAVSTALHDEGFAVMGLSELYRATGRQDVKNTLSRVLDTALFLYRNPRYLIDGTRSKKRRQMQHVPNRCHPVHPEGKANGPADRKGGQPDGAGGLFPRFLRRHALRQGDPCVPPRA